MIGGARPGPSYVALTTRNTVVNHDSLGFKVDNLWLLVLGVILEVVDCEQLGEGSKLNGKTDSVASRIILLHRLDNLGEDVLVVADYQVGDGEAVNSLELCPHNVGP